MGSEGEYEGGLGGPSNDEPQRYDSNDNGSDEESDEDEVVVERVQGGKKGGGASALPEQHPTEKAYHEFGLAPKPGRGARSVSSPVWTHFRRLKGGHHPGKAICTICVRQKNWKAAEIADGGGTSNFMSHIAARHKVSIIPVAHYPA
jgi:hypothetical protein